MSLMCNCSGFLLVCKFEARSLTPVRTGSLRFGYYCMVSVKVEKYGDTETFADRNYLG